MKLLGKLLVIAFILPIFISGVHAGEKSHKEEAIKFTEYVYPKEEFYQSIIKSFKDKDANRKGPYEFSYEELYKIYLNKYFDYNSFNSTLADKYKNLFTEKELISINTFFYSKEGEAYVKKHSKLVNYSHNLFSETVKNDNRKILEIAKSLRDKEKTESEEIKKLLRGE